MFFDRPRNWKWMIPAGLIAPCLIWWNDWAMMDEPWRSLAMAPLGLVIVLALASLVNLWAYVADRWANMFATIRAALNATPEVRMFEAAKGMHPQAVEALLLHRRTIWRVKYVPMADLADWILDEAPTVHAGFVDFVLDHSSGAAVMSKRLLSDGSKQFDPEGLVSDRQQYDDLILLLQQKLMCTQALGNQAPQWMPPWTPELVRHRFGLDGDSLTPDNITPSPPLRGASQSPAGEGSTMMKAVERAEGSASDIQRKGDGSATLNGTRQRDVREITDEEWERVNAELAAYPNEMAERARKLKYLENHR